MPDDQGEPRQMMHGNVVARNILSDGTTARPASGHPKARVTASGVNSGSPGQGLRAHKLDHTSWWPAPTSIQRKVRVCSSFVRFENAANDATNLKVQ